MPLHVLQLVEQRQLLRIGAPVLTYVFGSSKPKSRVRAHMNALDPVRQNGHIGTSR